MGLGNDVDMVSASLAGPALAAGSYRMSWYGSSRMGVPGYAIGTTLSQSFPTVGGSIADLQQGAAFQIYGTELYPNPARLR